MKIRNISHLVVSVLFLLQTLTLPVSLPELVLCVAEDHVRLEMKNLPADCDHDNSGETVLKTLKSTFHTDRCNDVPLFQHVRHVISKNQDLTRIILPVAVFPVTPKGVPQTSDFTTIGTQSPSIPNPSILSTVVLLI